MDWLPLLDNPAIIKIILNSLGFLQKEKRLTLYAYVIMKTHLHLVASSENISKEIANFRSYTARKSIDHLKEHERPKILELLSQQKLSTRQDREYQFWQQGVQPKRIHDRKMMTQKITYIHQNPVRKGYVDKAEDWQYSSAGIYAGKDDPLAVYTDW